MDSPNVVKSARAAIQLCHSERSVDRGFDAHDGSACPEIPKAALMDGGGEPPIYYRMVRVLPL
jgi:hypothetical protein